MNPQHAALIKEFFDPLTVHPEQRRKMVEAALNAATDWFLEHISSLPGISAETKSDVREAQSAYIEARVKAICGE